MYLANRPRLSDMYLPQNPLLRHVTRPPIPPQRHVPPVGPPTATCARPAGSSSATCAPGESATATCTPPADPASATCVSRRTGYCDMYPANRSRLSDMCLPQNPLLRHVPAENRLLRHVPRQPIPLQRHVPPENRLLRHVTRRPIPPQRHVPPAGPATATCDPPADPRLSDMYHPQDGCRRRSWSLGLETPTFAHRVGPGDVTVPAGRTRYRTQFRPAGPDIAPSSRRPDPGLPPTPRQVLSAPKKCQIFRSHFCPLFESH